MSFRLLATPFRASGGPDIRTPFYLPERACVLDPVSRAGCPVRAGEHIMKPSGIQLVVQPGENALLWCDEMKRTQTIPQALLETAALRRTCEGHSGSVPSRPDQCSLSKARSGGSPNVSKPSERFNPSTVCKVCPQASLQRNVPKTAPGAPTRLNPTRFCGWPGLQVLTEDTTHRTGSRELFAKGESTKNSSVKKQPAVDHWKRENPSTTQRGGDTGESGGNPTTTQGVHATSTHMEPRG
ncbi:uncharacterized protein LOC125715928 [Brienomyrus brachyistius]|uniref:uncharacterized protein LOC125715928 n=1 Tax=Brienomyrus brachyistius TaxID=42636 RepID=UPI0020B3CEFC|nr:uncharacterized protein LOC125715928 [Brienomyrus brachyistius]